MFELTFFMDAFFSVHSLYTKNSVLGFVTNQDESALQIERAVLLALVPVVVAFSFIVFVFYRAKRESFFKQKETEMKLAVAQVELKALRAQINPHFIFNCLNSIHHYMHQQDAAVAGSYLVKFSQLIRHVLESSTQRIVPLVDEIEANKIYMQLEQLRMNNSFEFSILWTSDINPDEVCIPPMLIQPFLENSIWHGISSGGKVEVEFGIKDPDHILCTIKDNGKKQHVKSEIDLSTKVKKTSLGMSLMRERFETLNQVSSGKAEFTFLEREDGVPGKQVIITIPFEV
ncbi:sensor histidine kinase [Aquiflexum gelatinilyticum]|uniref:Histidine kinase n=1 Tax=Aquiflexum gelatinilyticum TaxID=2961943 RepID=A0A9X2P861_9BACT|nr:histidine kinase [Aquiflexum gelatinilyticum]MCR9015510.1 histidine kinase [Aquiflexum gelatinilyticum]